jgi:hypothetical protein
LSEVENNIFSVYPNPTNDLVNIDLNSNETTSSIEICNLQGQKVYSANEVIGSIKIDFSDYKRGVYFIRVTNGNRLNVEKLILN